MFGNNGRLDLMHITYTQWE